MVLVSMLILTLAAASLVRKALATASASGMIAVRYNLALAGLSAVEAGAAIAAGGAAAPDLDVDAPSANYYAWRHPGEDARGVPAALQTRDAFPPGARVLTAGDLAVRYVVERLCVAPGPAAPERCTLSPPSVAAVSGSPEPGEQAPAPYYRVSARIDAPDGSAGYVQAMLGPGSAAKRVAWRIVDEP
ncbi:MAG TPA: hypothetical protein VFK60_09480 [Casimicrobiaceae bacterium]|nr:hypothetical protein [Casimicrobiaceae bacterium]